MAIALQGTPSLFESASATEAVIAYPTGTASGEVLVATVAISQDVALSAAPAGWTLLKAQNSVGPGSYPAVSVFYRVADGLETGNVTFGSWATAGRVTAIISRWSGVDLSNPIDVASVGSNSGVAISYTTPSITTVTNGSVLINSVGLNAATAADIDTPAGNTLVAKSTGTGRRAGQWYETQLGAGASGGTTFNENPTTTPLQWTGVVVALRTADAPVVPILNQRIVGIDTVDPKTKAVVQVKVNAEATSVRLRCAEDAAGTVGVIYGPAVTPSANGDAKLTVSGLKNNTRYYYRVLMTGSAGEVEDSLSPQGRLKTAPNGATSFSFCFGSCHRNTSTAAMWRIFDRGDDMFLHLGDLYYSDGTATTLANFRAKSNEKIALFEPLFATANTLYTPSDHDGFNNNTTGGSDPTAWNNWWTVHSELWPNTETYFSYVWGRVRFIITDDRTYHSNPSAADDASKTALGATQKQWLKDTITAATEPVIVIAMSAPWIGAAVAGDDGWYGATTERSELASFFAASGKNIAIISGDMHALAADDGTNSPGGVPVFQAAPLDNSSSIKGGPYSVAPYPTADGLGVTQYGRIVVTDTGTQISLSFTGYSASTDTARVNLTKTYQVGGGGTSVPAVFVNTPTGWVACKIQGM